MLKKIKLNNNREGSVLAFVLIILMVFSIMAAAMSHVFASNINMAKRQEDSLRAHYLALSGVDLTIATLVSRVEINGVSGKEIPMHEKIASEARNKSLTDELDIEGELVKIMVDYNVDKKEFTITSSVNTKENISKTLTLSIIFSGNSYKTMWK